MNLPDIYRLFVIFMLGLGVVGIAITAAIVYNHDRKSAKEEATKAAELKAILAHPYTLKKVVPHYLGHFIIQFGNNDIKTLSYKTLQEKKLINESLSLKELIHLKVSDEILSWPNGPEIHYTKLFEMCYKYPQNSYLSKYIDFGRANQAPTSQDLKHHVYSVALDPIENNILLNESIGGGLTESGGSFSYSMYEIRTKVEHKTHFELANAMRANQVIIASDSDEDALHQLIFLYA